MSWDQARSLLVEAEPAVAPAVAGFVTVRGEPVFAHHPERVFDLASLTKVLCTSEVALRLVAAGRLSLDDPHPALQIGQTVARLMQHSAGALWWKELYLLGDRAAILHAARTEPLAHAPGEDHVYSDLGFLTLGALLEEATGQRIDALWSGPLRWGDPRAEPTEGGLQGVVHDENARAMGGIAPHAGLFGTAPEVAQVANRWLDGSIPGAAEAFRRRGAGSHRLGWDGPSGSMSSAGSRPPKDAIGHTGFTGTSVWMSPEHGIVAVLLTNRVVYGRDPEAIRKLRFRWHQAVWDTLVPARKVLGAAR